MPRHVNVSLFGSMLDILRRLFTSQNFRRPLRKLLALWLYIKRYVLFDVVGGPDSRSERSHDTRSRRKPSYTDLGGVDSKHIGERGNSDTKDSEDCEGTTICASMDPTRLSISLDREQQTLHVSGRQSRPASVAISVHSDEAHRHTEGMLHPGYNTSHSNVSRLSRTSSRASSFRDYPHSINIREERHSQGPGPRASARGISRIASVNTRTPSASRSRSRVRSSQRSSRIEFHVESVSEAARSSTDRAPPTAISVAPPSTVRASASTLSSRSRNIYPIMAIQRYDRNVVLERAEPSFTLEPVTISYELRDVPPGWTACVHPEGALYFYHQDKHIFTDANLCDANLLDEIKAFMKRMDEEMDERREDCARLSSRGCDLVLELEDDGNDGYNWCYYFVDHTEKIIVWLHEYKLTWELDGVKAAVTLHHLKHEIQSKYWYHVEMFPYNRKIPKTDFEDLMSSLAYFDLDRTTSLTSTVAHTVDELDRMLSLTKRLQVVGNNDHVACSVGRMMCLLEHHRYMNFYGQYGARLSRDQSLVGKTQNPRTALISLLAPFLFNAPDVHLRSLEKIWIDGMIVYSTWSHFISRLQGEWQEFILYSTVLLNANVAFLAIPNVATNGPTSTPAQISSYLSITTSIGSILLGLLLVRQNRVKARETADEAARYLSKSNHPTLGLETLAIVYSLPYALLMWGMVTFLLAFSFVCFDNTDEVTASTTGVVWALIAGLVIWCVYTGWEIEEHSAWTKMKTNFQRVISSIHKKAELIQGWHDELKRTWTCRPQITEETPSMVDEHPS